ncbi:MAG TPA: hypothetical protein EYN52_00165, partial [Alphaproteobacteria bacterium]|nr:hypothetical protein [Alphaproteobacteria bacterium]
MAIANASSAPILTADGTPLKVSLKRSMRRSKIQALFLVLPAFLFLLVVFILPIGNLLTRSVDDTLVNWQLPLTFQMIADWDRENIPEEELFRAVFVDFTTVNKFFIESNRGSSVNTSDAAWWVAIPPKGPYREAIIQINPAWGDVVTWQPLKEIVDRSLEDTGSEKDNKHNQRRATFDL